VKPIITVLVAEVNASTYYAFELKSNGKACFTKSVDGHKEVFLDDIETGNKELKEKDIEQSLFINGDSLELYIQDKTYFEGRAYSEWTKICRF
jgi:hypothetical protein